MHPACQKEEVLPEYQNATLQLVLAARDAVFHNGPGIQLEHKLQRKQAPAICESTGLMAKDKAGEHFCGRGQSKNLVRLESR